MASQAQTVIHNVKGNQIPKEWARKLHIDPEADADKLFEVTFKRVEKPKKKASLPELQAIAKQLQELPDINSDFREDDLYDEYGLPK